MNYKSKYIKFKKNKYKKYIKFKKINIRTMFNYQLDSLIF